MLSTLLEPGGLSDLYKTNGLELMWKSVNKGVSNGFESSKSETGIYRYRGFSIDRSMCHRFLTPWERLRGRFSNPARCV